MATNKVDDFAPGERTLIVEALKLLLTSQLRAARAASAGSVQDAYKSEAAKTEALIAKFH